MNERPPSGFFDELRRRGGLRALALYLAGAWLAIEVADTTFPRLGLPDWAVTLVVWVAVLSLPLVVVLVWVFEVEGGRVRRDRRASRRSTLWMAAGAGVLTAVAATGAWFWLHSGTGPAGAPMDARDRVAVLPFSTAGANPDLGWLREGVLTLLATKLTGEVGPRAVDARTVMSAWEQVAESRDSELSRDAALSVALEVGARRAIIGSVVGSHAALTISAALVPTGGRGRAVSANVSGPADSLPALVDRLAAILLSLESGQDARDLEALAGAPLPALRSFLQGEAAYRRGEYDEALERFQLALNVDSTFAMAAFGIERAAPWIARSQARERGRRLAWKYRDRLSALDRLHLTARAGPAYPAHPTVRELLETREQAVQVMPDRADVWYELGDLFFHWGSVIGDPHPFDRALEGFQRALELDPGFAAPLHHSIMIAAVRRDVATVRRLRGRLDGSHAIFAGWLEATLSGDSARLEGFRAAMDTVPSALAVSVIGTVLDVGLPLEFAYLGVESLMALPGTAAEKRTWLQLARTVALNAGRPGEATRVLDAHAAIMVDADHAHRLAILDALYAGGDSTRAELAASRLERSEAGEPRSRLQSRCLAAQWRLWHGEPLGDPTLPERAREAAGGGRGDQSELAVCAEVVDALATAPGPERDARLDRLDSLLLVGPYSGLTNQGTDPYHGNLALARLRERAGDLEGALAASRRWPFFHGQTPYVAEMLQAEARLARELGRRDGALAAYQHFLAIRANPEPARLQQADLARAALAQLSNE